MSKRKKKEMTTILVFAGILLVVCVAYFAAIKHKEAKDKAADTSVNLLQLDSSLAEKIEIVNEKGNITFQKEASGWVITDDKEFLVKQSVVESLLDKATNVTAVKCVVDTKDELNEYGLEKPSSKVTVTLEDGTTVEVCVGDKAPAGMGYYAMLDRSKGVFIMTEDSVSEMLLDKSMFKDSAEESIQNDGDTTDIEEN